ncbi:uncharacterized protein PV06_06467 [Exophiala oligosperma]|nr:uncharacterized protein PV06_06467 [Exophiala oligosperma]KIW42978.1 hypothetical protein PV06_06467 [Exophiala oligosperma]
MSIPFYFIVSKKIPSSDPQSPEHCLQLPPSIELGAVIVDETGKRFAQPSISYALRAKVCFAARTDDETMPPVESSLPLILRPRTKEFPPTDTIDFPTEFKLQVSKSVRRSLFARNLGTLTVSIQEPRPLIYDASSMGSLTECHVGLELLALDSGDVHQALQAMEISIHSWVRVKTFYSVKSFSQLPSQTLLSSDGKTRLRDDFLKLETRNLPHVSWSYQYHSVESGGDDANNGSTTQPDSGSSSCSGPASPSQAPSGRWTARFTHPIRVQSRVLPTFCSAIVARLYTVIVRLKVSGIRRESFNLEIPLQVVHASSNDASDEEYPFIRPLEEDRTSMDFRRASTTSWFSDESLASSTLFRNFIPLILLRIASISLLTITHKQRCADATLAKTTLYRESTLCSQPWWPPGVHNGV